MTVPGRLAAFLRREQLARRYRIVAFVGLLGIAISRAPYLLFHGRFYAEEGSRYFPHMREESIWFIARPVGYIYAFVNGSTWLATRVPLERAPLVTAWLSLGVVAAVIWAALSWPSELLPNAGTRIAAATLLVVSPMAVPEVWLNSTNVQVYFGVLALLLLFVDVTAIGRAEFAGATFLLALAGLSGVYAALLAPLYLYRAYRERGRRMMLLAVVLSLCAIAQVIVVTQHLGSGHLANNTGHFRGLGLTTRDVAEGQVSTFLFGESIADRLQAHFDSTFGLLVFGVFALVVIAVLVSILASVSRPRVGVWLVLALVLTEVLVLFGTHGRHALGRYVVVPIAILVLMAVHGTTARNRLGAGIATVVCVAAFIAGSATFWTGGPTTLGCVKCPEWDQQVRAWRAGASDVLLIWPYTKGHWAMRLPRSHTVSTTERRAPVTPARRVKAAPEPTP